MLGSTVRGGRSIIKPMPVRPRQEATPLPTPSFGPPRHAASSYKTTSQNVIAGPQRAGPSQRRAVDLNEEDYWRDDPFEDLDDPAEAQATWDAIDDICAAAEKRTGAGELGFARSSRERLLT